MSDLPVTEMILYKHGVGFFKREGKVKSDEVRLTFRHDEINDVLKSLVVFDQGEGDVLGIHYQTPLDVAALRADTSIKLSDEASLRDLLRDLRGRNVELSFAEQTIRGRLIGVDLVENEPVENTLLSIQSDEDEVSVFRLRALRSIGLLDSAAQQDLRFFLDSSVSEELRRTVTVRLSPGGKHRLVAYYVAPCPSWRVSYRFVGESGEEGQTGSALLQGWGLFDNRLDEDLENVRVTLVAGQPISFVYDLYSSRIPERPVIEDEARVAPGPVEFRGTLRERPRRARALADVAAREELAAGAYLLSEMDVPSPLTRDAVESGAPPAAEGREATEFFQYVVSTPVSVRRGESALVPIIGANVAYSRELLYNGAKLPHHPAVALRFDNTTGLTLERGPVTILEDGEYKGEALIPFTKADNEVYLAYAVELGIRVTENTAYHTRTAGLNIREGYLLINGYRVVSTTYRLENTTARDQTVTIEAPVRSEFELFDTPDPSVETATERRWRVTVPAHDSVEFVRRERRLMTRREQVRDLDYRRLQRFLQDRWLDQETFDSLSRLLDNLAFIDRARAEQEELRVERSQIYERQAQLRENLAALKPAGEEGVLRARILHQFEGSEDRLEEIEARVAELARQIAQAEELNGQILTELEGRHT